MKMDCNEDHEYTKKRSKCSTKNAIVARKNRQKKKEYLTCLEGKVLKLCSENTELKQRLENSDKQLELAQHENKYLRSVIANRKEIERLLRVVKIGSGLDVTSSLRQSAGVSPQPTSAYSIGRYAEDLNGCPSVSSEGGDLNARLSPCNLFDDTLVDDMNSPLFCKGLDVSTFSGCDISDSECPEFEANDLSEDVGICLHVSKHRASLELCAVCSSNASAAWKAEMNDDV